MKPIETYLAEFDKVWNEHDGDYHYKDEWKDYFKNSLQARDDEWRALIEGMKVPSDIPTPEEMLMLFGKHPILRNSDIARDGYSIALNDLLEKINSKQK